MGQSWYDCVDIVVKDDDGEIIYDGPKFLRCAYPSDCGSIVTHGWLDQNDGHCYCGGRKFRAALMLKPEEQRALMMGKHPLNEWETKMVGDDSI